VFSPATQHCYLVDEEQRTFAAAQTHCKALKAHLITLANQAENDFAWSLHGDEHWIGSQDGKTPKQSGVGTYTWVTGEPFDYTNWSQDQPNASKTDCVEGGACYEHCAFQWKGGDHDSMWNDRYCMHTIASICEWDSVP
jgi:Lectin C-type domain